MTETFRTSLESTLPQARTNTEFNIGDDPVAAAIYTNLAYDIYAAATAKLGWEYTRWQIGEQSRAEFDAKMAQVFSSLALDA